MNALLLSALCFPLLGIAWFHVICRLMLNHRSCRNRAQDVAEALDLRFPGLQETAGGPWLGTVETLEREFKILRKLAGQSARIRETMAGEVLMLAIGFYVADGVARLTGSLSKWMLRQALKRMWLATAAVAECVGEYQPVRRRAPAPSFRAIRAGSG